MSSPTAMSARPAIAPFRRAEHDIGRVIVKLEGEGLIAGVEIEPATLFPDDRGFFAELFRFGQPGIARDFTAPVQVSTALSHPGTIKAVHFHRYQTDLWAPVAGMLQVALFDLRPDAATHGQVNTLYIGDWRPWKLRIPPGVGHGYKVIGASAAQLVYATNRFYDPADEGRIPYNDPGINYDWEYQYK